MINNNNNKNIFIDIILSSSIISNILTKITLKSQIWNLIFFSTFRPILLIEAKINLMEEKIMFLK